MSWRSLTTIGTGERRRAGGRAAVRERVSAGERLFLCGGCCAALPGALAGARDAGGGTTFTMRVTFQNLGELVADNAYKLDMAVDPGRDWRFEYFGLRTVYDRYLLKDPVSRLVTETPQYFFLRVACGLADTAREAIDFYELISGLEYLPSTPTLFNSGTNHSQMSSCYLLDSPRNRRKWSR